MRLYLGFRLLLAAALLSFASFAGTAGPRDQSPLPLLKGPAPGLGEADGLVSQCLLLFALGNLGGAEQACSGALVLDPQRADALKLRGYAYLVEGRVEKAAADFRAGLRLKPLDDQLWAGYGQTFSDMGNFAEALVQFHKAVELAPQKPAYWSSLCWTQGATGEKLEDALAACNTALRLAPQAAAPYNSRGLVQLRMGRWAEAIADYRHSLNLSSEQASAWFGLGLARLSSGDLAGAADIRVARQKNIAIDWVFIVMGVLPEWCDMSGRIICPPGFPAISFKPRGFIAKAPDSTRREILRLAGFLAP